MEIDLEDLHKVADYSAAKLDFPKEQTLKKIAYVTKYVQEWICVGTQSKRIHTLNFVDGMANAGIYSDGSLGTATTVYSLFIDAAIAFPNKRFNLVVNDLDSGRVSVFQYVCKRLLEKKGLNEPLKNLSLVANNLDINEFLAALPEYDSFLTGFRNFTLLFIDPYDARTVNSSLLRDYVSPRYCELFYNWFSSDHIRNHEDEEIKACFSGIDIPPGYDAADFIANYLADDKKYYFSFPFRNMNNSELYQIIFLTPNLTGLEKLKEALWDTFSGAEYHRNERGDYHQTSLLDLPVGKDYLKKSYGCQVQKLITDELDEADYSYREIELFVLRRSMLGANDVIRFVIRPLIAQGTLIKNNKVSNSANFKNDSYHFMTRNSDGVLQ